MDQRERVSLSCKERPGETIPMVINNYPPGHVALFSDYPGEIQSEIKTKLLLVPRKGSKWKDRSSECQEDICLDGKFKTIHNAVCSLRRAGFSVKVVKNT